MDFYINDLVQGAFSGLSGKIVAIEDGKHTVEWDHKPGQRFGGFKGTELVLLSRAIPVTGSEPSDEVVEAYIGLGTLLGIPPATKASETPDGMVLVDRSELEDIVEELGNVMDYAENAKSAAENTDAEYALDNLESAISDAESAASELRGTVGAYGNLGDVATEAENAKDVASDLQDRIQSLLNG